MIDLQRPGRFEMRGGGVAEVWGKDVDPHPYPWFGEINGAPDDDGWDRAGRSWKSPALDLVRRVQRKEQG